MEIGAVSGGSLSGIRVVEMGGSPVEYCGLTLAGLGAEVIKIEPPDGEMTRRRGPFYQDEPGPDRSLHFWAYNRGKRSVILDMDSHAAELGQVLDGTDIFIESSPKGWLAERGWPGERLMSDYPSLIHVRVTPFGDDGPWSDFATSDLVHLALSGVLMNCGYDPEPDGNFDLPPIAPQYHHAYHISGEQIVIGILGALVRRARTGRAQVVSCAVHEAVAKCTETDLMSWIMLHQPYYRMTGRHAGADITPDYTEFQTKDGRWVNVMSVGKKDRAALKPFLESYGMGQSLQQGEASADAEGRFIPGTTDSWLTATAPELIRFMRRFTGESVPWLAAQDAGMFWAPIRKPHENATDQHWLDRRAYSEIHHPELGRTFTYPASKWLASRSSWQAEKPAPLLGEDTKAAASAHGPRRSASRAGSAPEQTGDSDVLSPHGKPWCLEGIRVLDFTWFLASAGGTRFLSGLGADCLKVEWHENPDTRYGGYPVGGRDARRTASGPLPQIPPDPDMGGQFNNKNPGKRGISLNVRHPQGLEIAKRLVQHCDIVAEGFSPGVMDRLGLGYEVLRDVKPDIIYARQSGMGGFGKYGRLRAVGPNAAALSGLTEMGGLPDPAPPSGWGYSYLDWLGAYSFAVAILSALYQREATGEGQLIDASQTEVGLFTTSVPMLEWSANGRPWQRAGNRAPYGDMAPQGVYRCQGQDRWLAITCDSDEGFFSLARLLDRQDWLADSGLASVAGRVSRHDELDRGITGWTSTRDAYAAMAAVQAAGVAAGVAQTAEDRCETDPQLKALSWLTELTGTKIGTWPLAELPFKMSETPTHIGGRLNRAAPCYGEDTGDVLHELLGMDDAEVAALRREGVIAGLDR